MNERCEVVTCARPASKVVNHPHRSEEKTAVCDFHATIICEEAGGEIVE
jgi:hypothetical protein